MESDGKLNLDEQEVLGNIFTLMFAGHETTASAVTATLGYLAIYEEEQEKAYEEISKALPRSADLTLDDLQNLYHLLACFHEASRIYRAFSNLNAPIAFSHFLLPASGFGIIRELTENIAITVTRLAKQRIALQKGTLVVIDIIAIRALGPKKGMLD
ncbi:cytochrome P450 [Mycena albidolilacea]|uniref:Cytochrome P450 n=1 Tax=Mycena albidolilacea TaxID=1033008 RepID=A0AAD7AL96_9AGAR|nr:cytochrome P450 [Mycena albidolilacea]